MVQINNKKFEPYIDEKELQRRILELAERINFDYGDREVVFVSVLNGSFIFLADLIRQINVQAYVQFIRVFSYSGLQSTGKINEVIGLNETLKDKHVIIVEDIIDTGRTIDYIFGAVKGQNPASVKIVSLLLKRDVYQGNVEIDYIGFEIPNRFVLGYGLDYEGLGRNLPFIYQLKE